MRRTCALLVFVIAALALNSARSQENTAPGAPAEQPASKPDSNSVPQSASPPDSTALQLIKKVKPDYPLAALPDKLQGQVIVKIVVSETGDVESTEVVSGNPVLTRSALDAVKKWKFNPFLRHGKPVKASTKLTFDFAYSENVKDIQPPPTPASKPEPQRDADRLSDAATSVPRVALPQRVRVSAGVTQGLVLTRSARGILPQRERRTSKELCCCERSSVKKGGKHQRPEGDFRSARIS